MDIDKQNGLIRAGLAQNAHSLLTQYGELELPEESRYDVTLCLCVTQMLLANSVELAKATNNASRKAAWLEPLEAPLARIRSDPGAVELLTAAAPFVPIVRALRETLYQFTSPYVMDSSAITAAFGLEPPPWDEVCRRTAR